MSSHKPTPNNSISLEQRSDFFKALGHPSRVLIVNLCKQKSRHTEELASILSITPATVSHHLKQLEAAGILEGIKDGYYQNYSVKKPGSEDKVPFSSLSRSGGVVNVFEAVKLAGQMKGKKKGTPRA